MRHPRLLLMALLVLPIACHRESPSRDADANAISPAPDARPSQPQTDHAVARLETWTLQDDFDAGTTLEELQLRYGKANASARELPGAEGETFRGVLLFPDDPTRRATLYFQDPEHLRGLSMVSVNDAGSRWKLASGIGIGTSLADVQARNGKPFVFSGFDWDYGGTITDWQGGKLQPNDNNAVSERLQLQMPEAGAGDRPYPMGDGDFASDDPRWKDLEITVGGISVGFPGEDDL